MKHSYGSRSSHPQQLFRGFDTHITESAPVDESGKTVQAGSILKASQESSPPPPENRMEFSNHLSKYTRE